MPQAVRLPKNPGPYQVAISAGARAAFAASSPSLDDPWDALDPPVASPPAAGSTAVAPPVVSAREVAPASRIMRTPSTIAHAATRSGRGPVDRYNGPLFLALTGLADGLALKES